MDFSTIRRKLPDYRNLTLFRKDFELMCENAMTYNTPDTIYYKCAEKMSKFGQNLFSLEKIKSTISEIGLEGMISDELLGIQPSENKNISQQIDELFEMLSEEISEDEMTDYESSDDEVPKNEILNDRLTSVSSISPVYLTLNIRIPLSNL